MNEEKPKKEDTLEKRLVDLHPKFLKTIKEVYPLAVLGSLCIAIAGFTAQTYPDAQTCAINAASLFLIAFAISFLFKIMPLYYLALISYISTALAIVFLFLVVVAFAQAIPMVSKSVSTIQDGAAVVVFSMLGYLVYRLGKKSKSRVIRLCCTISVPLILIGITYYVVGILAKFIGISLPNFIFDIFLGSMLGLAFSLTMIILTEHKDRKKKKEKEI
jgi:hypothetical protein